MQISFKKRLCRYLLPLQRYVQFSKYKMAAKGGHLGFLRSKVIADFENRTLLCDESIYWGDIFLMISSPWARPDNVGLVLVGVLIMAQEKQINIFISYFIKKFKSCFFWTDFLENIYIYRNNKLRCYGRLCDVLLVPHVSILVIPNRGIWTGHAWANQVYFKYCILHQGIGCLCKTNISGEFVLWTFPKINIIKRRRPYFIRGPNVLKFRVTMANVTCMPIPRS